MFGWLLGLYLVLVLHWLVRKPVIEFVTKLVFNVEKKGASVCPTFKVITSFYIAQMTFQFAFYFIRG